MTRSRLLVTAVLVALLTSACVRVQSATGAVTPPDVYRAALVGYGGLLGAPQTGNWNTVGDMQASLVASREGAIAERDRLAAITPDPCYADAHAQYLAFMDFSLRFAEDLIAELDTATTFLDILPFMIASGAEGEARFPAFYRPGPSPAPERVMAGSGDEFDYVLGFDVLNTCGMPVPSARPGG